MLWKARIEPQVERFGIWGTAIGIVWGAMTWVASQIPSLSGSGWATFVFIGLGAACVLSLVVSAGLVAWRYFNPLPPPKSPAAPVAAAQLGRIPIIDFMKIAEARGWKIFGTHDLEGVDLLDGLRQAGVDGEVQFWGCLNRFGNRALIEHEVRIPINCEHWHEYQFDWGSVLGQSTNLKASTYRMHETNNQFAGGYIDIRLDGDAALQWLQSPAALEFKGRRDRMNRERSAR